jgi:predicted nuclease of predicted toxin-antitoxin system
MADLAFSANMNISPITVAALREMGWDIERVSDVMHAGTKDIDVLHYAREKNRVIITQDLDYSMLLAVGGFSRPGLINVRVENAKPDFVASRIIDAVGAIENELKEGAVVTVDETSVRYRSLPLK